MNKSTQKLQEILDIILTKQLLKNSYWVSSPTHRDEIRKELDLSRATYYRRLEKLKEKNVLQSTPVDNTYYVVPSNIINYEKAV